MRRVRQVRYVRHVRQVRYVRQVILISNWLLLFCFHCLRHHVRQVRYVRQVRRVIALLSVSDNHRGAFQEQAHERHRP